METSSKEYEQQQQQQYEVVVATSAMICKKGLLPTPELALFRRLYLTLD